MDDVETKDGFRWSTSAGKLQVLKSKLPLETLMSGIRLGRSELSVRAYLTNGTLDKGDVQLLRNFLKQVGGTIFIRSLCWWFADSNSSDVVGMFLTAADHHGDGFLQVS